MDNTEDTVSERPIWYLLDEQGNPYPTKDTRAANELLGRIEERSVGYVEKTIAGHQIRLSTVFLVLDHGCPGIDGDVPVLYESMLFIDSNGVGNATQRYTTRDLALKGHNEIAGLVDEIIDEMGKSTHVAGILASVIEKLAKGGEA